MPGAQVHARSTALDYTLTTYMLDYTHTHSRVTLRVVLSISRDTHSRVTLRVVLSIYKYSKFQINAIVIHAKCSVKCSHGTAPWLSKTFKPPMFRKSILTDDPPSYKNMKIMAG